MDQQTGCHAQRARSVGNQEAAAKRLARRLHHERWEPRHLAEAVLRNTGARLRTKQSKR
jgi:hypothetical protein